MRSCKGLEPDFLANEAAFSLSPLLRAKKVVTNSLPVYSDNITNGCELISCIDNNPEENFEQDLIKTQLFRIYIRCVTWSKDSHGLFDYESRHIVKKNIKTLQTGSIVRLDNDVEFVSPQMPLELISPHAKPLLTISKINGKFFVQNDTICLDQNPDQHLQSQMFVVVRNVKSQQQIKNEEQPRFLSEYRVNKGDTIKMGRLKFLVKDYRSDSICANIDTNSQCSPIKKSSILFENEDGIECGAEEEVEIECGVADESQQIQCKICWCEEQSIENPLLCSCKCDGSVRYIHYNCLTHWLKQKMTMKDNESYVSYTWKQFECEICKTPYPYVFKSQGRKYRLVDVTLPAKGNFLWLESLTFEKNSSRIVHVIKPGKKTEFTLGRGNESDLRVNDISVSRCHAIIKYDHEVTQRFYLEDNLSKFGTLVLANNGIVELDLESTKAIQIGRSVISFTVKRVESNLKSPQPLFQPKQIILKTPSPLKLVSKQISDSGKQDENIEELRRKIEETSLKIHDYLQQSTKLNQMQSQQRESQSFKYSVSGFEPQRLDFAKIAASDNQNDRQMMGHHLTKSFLNPSQVIVDLFDDNVSDGNCKSFESLKPYLELPTQTEQSKKPQVICDTVPYFQTKTNEAEQRQSNRKESFQQLSKSIHSLYEEEAKRSFSKPNQNRFQVKEGSVKFQTSQFISPSKRHFSSNGRMNKPSGDTNTVDERESVSRWEVDDLPNLKLQNFPSTGSQITATTPELRFAKDNSKSLWRHEFNANYQNSDQTQVTSKGQFRGASSNCDRFQSFGFSMSKIGLKEEEPQNLLINAPVQLPRRQTSQIQKEGKPPKTLGHKMRFL